MSLVLCVLGGRTRSYDNAYFSNIRMGSAVCITDHDLTKAFSSVKTKRSNTAYIGKKCIGLIIHRFFIARQIKYYRR